MGDAGDELIEHDFDWRLEFARLEVITAFVHWLWWQERLNELVNSYDGNSNRAWLVTFAKLRRAARNAQFSWVAALYEFKGLVEKKTEDSGKREH